MSHFRIVLAAFIALAPPAAALAVATAAPAGRPAASGALDHFEQRVRPLLLARCATCHGEKVQQAGLRLDRAQALEWRGRQGGLIDPAKPEESLILKAVRHEGLKMPPAEKLPAAEIETLRRWVLAGAPWTPESAAQTGNLDLFFAQASDHWSLQPVTRRPLPRVSNPDWRRTPVDSFILAELDRAGLKPSPEADRRTLIRRIYFDLIGLPPSPAEVDAFEADPAPDAYERLVERLLASPRYGERWARHWLDVARYADTKDGVLMYGNARLRPHAFTYRDYVIRAMNDDTPYDQFIREQIAADRLGPSLPGWRLGAMGFLTLGRIFDANVHDVIDDQIDTVSRGFLGLTVACARCHDHKYDPIPTADYYSLYGVFGASEPPLELPLTGEPAPAPDAAWDAKDAAKRKEVTDLLQSQYELQSRTARERIDAYLHHIALEKADPLEGVVFFRSLAPEDLRPPLVSRWRSYLKEHARPDDPVWGPWADYLAIPPAQFTASAAAVAERWRSRLPGTGAGQLNPLVRQALVDKPPGDPAEVTRRYGALLTGVWKQRAEAPAPADAAAWKQLLSLVEGPGSPADFPRSQTFNYMSRAEKDRYGALQTELDVLAAGSGAAPPRAMVLVDAEASTEPRIFVRGSPAQLGDAVPRRFLKVLSGREPRPFGPGSGRLDLAESIADPHNPLTSRVLVNRVWMHHFGQPLVRTPNDFGFRSEPPRQGALLDFLAAAFVSPSGQQWRDSPSGAWIIGSGAPRPGEMRWEGMGWSIKALHRMIVLSSAYRQSSGFNPAAARLDGENDLYWRQNRKRLELEAMRDSMLAVAGRLDPTMYGSAVDVAGDPDSRRRTIYGLVDRQSLPQLYRAFDFASPDQSAERRPNTVVPQQALFGLNSNFVLLQAKALASHPSLQTAGSPAERVAILYRQVLQRNPRPEELSAALRFVEQAPARPPLPGAVTPDPWAQFAQVLLLTNEFHFVD